MAGGGVWLVADVDAWQVRWQRLALRLVFDAWCDGLGTELFHLVMNGLRVLIQRFFQQASLLGTEALGLRRKLQPFEQRVLMREFVDGGLFEGGRLAQRLHHLAQFFRVQMCERVGGDVHGAESAPPTPVALSAHLPIDGHRCVTRQMTVMTLASPTRCHGKPSTRASSCSR